MSRSEGNVDRSHFPSLATTSPYWHRRGACPPSVDRSSPRQRKASSSSARPTGRPGLEHRNRARVGPGATSHPGGDAEGDLRGAQCHRRRTGRVDLVEHQLSRCRPVPALIRIDGFFCTRSLVDRAQQDSNLSGPGHRPNGDVG
jgi:hypothetical protein